MSGKNILLTLSVIIVVAAGIYWFVNSQSITQTTDVVQTMSSTSSVSGEAPNKDVRTAPVAGVMEYKGEWFKISYPKNFIAKAEGPDEASFTSPDGAVQFYIYSPQWSGDPEAYLKPFSNEIVQSDESTTETTSADYPQKVTRNITYAAKDGSYKRSLVSIKTGIPGQDATFHLVFGIRYSNQTTYNKYLNEYLAFKKSLVQFAD